MGFWQRLNHLLASVGGEMPAWLWSFAVGVVIAGAIIQNKALVRTYPEYWLLALGLWWLWSAAIGAAARNRWGMVDAGYRVRWMLPLSPAEIFRERLKGFFWGTGMVSVVFSVLYLTIASAGGLRLSIIVGGVVVAALQAAVLLALIAWLMVVRVGEIFLPLPMLAAAGLLMLTFKASLQPLVVAACCRVNPAGWSNALFFRGLAQGRDIELLNLLPILLSILSLPFAVRILWRRHLAGEFRKPRTMHGNLVLVERREKPVEAPALVDERGFVLGGSWLHELDGRNPGMVERWLKLVLSRREMSVTDVLTPPEVDCNRRFQRLLLCFGLFILVSAGVEPFTFEEVLLFLVRAGPGSVTNVVCVAGCGVLFLLMVAYGAGVVLAGSGSIEPAPARSTRPFQSAIMPGYCRYRLLPMNFWEACLAGAKASAIVAVWLLPIAVLLELTPFFNLFPKQWNTGLGWPPKLVVAMWGLAVVASAFRLLPTAYTLWK
jgi:hypothetical protein